MADRLMASTDRVPSPDPTVLTTQGLLQAIAALREILEARMDGQQALAEQRVVSVDTAVKLLQGLVAQQPALVDAKLENLRILHEEKFKSIQTQFLERDVRAEGSAKDQKVAVDAALQAAKEAVGEQNKSSALAINKSETATNKQIEQMGLLITTATKGIDDKISDLKDRLTAIESGTLGGHKVKDDSRATIAIVVAALVALFEVASFFRTSKIEVPPIVVNVPAPQQPALPQSAPR